MLDRLKRIILITGYYGCGKTNLSVNLALDYAEKGEEVSIMDLDIVNPFFRTADFKRMLEENGIKVITPKYANTLADTPSIPREAASVFISDQRVIADIGGDDAGAVVLGRFSDDIKKGSGADMLYLFSVFRPGTADVNEIARNIEAIETVSRQKVTYLVNSSNLGAQTQLEDIKQSENFARQLEELTDIPLLTTLVMEELAGDIKNVYRVKRLVRLPWEPPHNQAD